MPSPILGEHRLLEVIAFQAEIAGAVGDPSETMRLACERAQTVTGGDGAVIEVREREQMVYHVCCGTLAAQAGLRLSVHESLSGLSVRTGSPLRCDDSETDPRVDIAACRRVGLRSMLCVPLRRAGAVVGVLKVVSGRPEAFDDVDVAILTVLGGVIAGAMSQAELIRRLTEEATTDALTGVANRRQWSSALDAVLGRASRSGRAAAVILLDLDGFKSINDRDGHGAGDGVLVHVAREWSALVRAGELLARTGGDEFAVLIEDATPASIRPLVHRLRQSVAPVCGVSAGVAFTKPEDDADAVMHRADLAMYADKVMRRAAATPNGVTAVVGPAAASTAG